MSRKIAYWGTTVLVAIEALFGAFTYLTTAPEAVENFRHVALLGLLAVSYVTRPANRRRVANAMLA